jgi:hypothetical protein
VVRQYPNKSTRRAYENAIQDFMGFTGIAQLEEFRRVTRAHVIAWRDDLARRELGGAKVRHRLAALSSLFVCDSVLLAGIFKPGRRQAAAIGKRRGQDAGTGRPSGPGIAGRAL